MVQQLPAQEGVSLLPRKAGFPFRPPPCAERKLRAESDALHASHSVGAVGLP